ncbi:uncharacterized protein LOC129956666 [Argiope bruennichi]|uniref:uncharacterized protein LOC129956666 n=1 Tax=Argiope bruennichi TaxID=94029 RepID=UPI002493ECA2|nr:uncharacterized protein LOC129956666 [Argiope bruennichi]
MRSGDLLVEVCSKKQSHQILKLKALATIPVSVQPHLSLNYSKGVITCGQLFNVPLEEILKELQGQGVTHVRRITIRRDGQILDTKHLILTFHSPKLPEFIYAGYMKLPVRHYIPNPLRCFQCQRFGHSKANCRGAVTCARCAEKGHESQQCTAQEKCVNCDGNHSSFSRSCKRWTLEKQVIALKIKESLSYPEARRRILAETPTPGLSYASANKPKTKPPEKTSDSDTERSTASAPETCKPGKNKQKLKSSKSLKLKLAKRGLKQNDLPIKLKKSVLKNSAALGLAAQGKVHKDLTSIFGGITNSPDIKLHPSEDESELEMSCEDLATSTTASSRPSSKPVL